MRKNRFFLWNLFFTFGIILLVKPVLAEEKSLYGKHHKRDPFVPLVTTSTRSSVASLLAVESIDDLIVEGVVHDEVNGSIVMVNGTIIKEGEQVAGVKVVEVAAKGARFLINGTEGFKEIYQGESSS